MDQPVNYEPMLNCTCGALETVVEYQDKDYLIKFLMGLDDSYKGMIGQILMMRPFSSMNKVFSIIQQEEKQRQISIKFSANRAMAFSIKDAGKSAETTNPNREKYFCTHRKASGHSLERCYKANPNIPLYTHCNKLGHTIETCYKLKGLS